MPYYISELKLEGIRGINRAVSIPFQRGVNLIYGPNGSGKSSILQALEWCITGVMPYMRGGDFAKEDAIVNMFHPDEKATVVLRLEGVDPALVLTRTRRMASSTAKGRQPFQLQYGSQVKKDEEAENELAERLGLDLEAFGRTKYLHQEAIREVLSSRPEERSEAIDRLLGTLRVREFVNALDTGRRIQNAVRNIEASIQSLEKDKVQLNLNLKKKLEEDRKTLLEKGYKGEELTLASAVSMLNSLRKQIIELRSSLGLKTYPVTPISASVQSLVEAQRALLEEISRLDRERMELQRTNQAKRIRLRQLYDRYSTLLRSFEDSKTSDLDSLKLSLREIDDELENLRSITASLQRKMSTLPSRRSTYEDTRNRIDREELNLALLKQKYGNLDEIERRLSDIENELKKCTDDLEKQSIQQRLINIAVNILEKTQTANCPVCSQSIDNVNLVKELKARTSKEVAIKIQELQGREEELKKEMEALVSARREQLRINETIDSLRRKLDAASKSISELIEKPMEAGVDLDNILADWEREQRLLLDQVGKLRSERDQIEENIRRLDQFTIELEDTLRQLRQETGSQAEGSLLLDVCMKQISHLEAESNRYEETTGIDEVRAKLIRLSDILALLRNEEAVEALDRELPTISKQIEDLRARKESLQLLESSLQMIRKLANEYEKQASITQLARLESDLNQFYSTISGHPYFSRLKVEIEREEPLIYSIRAVSAREATYIPTRFSTAQLNAAALAIFMSNSSRTKGELPLMILDDPTQSMDSEHKEALAKLVSKLAETYQMIVSTEDEETRNLLERYCRGIRVFELGEWTTTGPNIKQLAT